MTYILASDSFKGCLSSASVNKALADAILLADPQAAVIQVPMSDGGEGYLDAVQYSKKDCKTIALEVHDPLGRPISAYYLFDGHTAIIESAKACGLTLMTPEERNPLEASTYGVGELIVDAIKRNAHKVVISLGGSGTSDCGRGMLKALYDGDLMPHSAASTLLSWAAEFRQYLLNKGIEVIAATDVTNPLYGENGAAHVFAPQKGATEEMVVELDKRAQTFAKEASEAMGLDYSHENGAGAAGGLGYACMQFLGAKCKSGADILLDMLDFSHLLATADVVITGEGSADRQTLFGKLPERVLRRAQEAGVKTWLLAGRVSDREALLAAGFEIVDTINPPAISAVEAMKKDIAIENLQNCCQRWVLSEH